MDLFKYVAMTALIGILIILIFIFRQNRTRLKKEGFSNINETKEYFEIKTRLNVAIATFTIIGFLLAFFGFDTIENIEDRTEEQSTELLENLDSNFTKFKEKQDFTDSIMSFKALELEKKIEELETLLGSSAVSASKRIARIQMEYEELMTYIEDIKQNLPKQKFVIGKLNRAIPEDDWVSRVGSSLPIKLSSINCSPSIKSFSGVKIAIAIWKGESIPPQVESSYEIKDQVIEFKGPHIGGGIISDADILLFY